MPIDTRRIGLLGLALSVIAISSHAFAQEAKRPITVEEAVGTLRVFLGQVDISPDGTLAAYVVRAPNVNTNKDEYRLYVRSLDQIDRRDNGRLLLESDSPFRGLRWVAHGKKLVVSGRNEAKDAIMLVDPETGKVDVAVSGSDPIEAFSVNEAGNLFAYSGTDRKTDPSLHSIDYSARGFPVSFGKGTKPSSDAGESPGPTITIIKKQDNEQFTPERLYPDNPKLCRGIPALKNVYSLSLSPNGRYLTFNYISDEVPAAWQSNVLVEFLRSVGNGVDQLGICDLMTSEFRAAFNAPLATAVSWSQDSEAFSVNSISPIGSSWEQEDKDSGFTVGTQYESFVHLFVVKLKTRAVSQAVKKLAVYFANPTLFWERGGGRMLVRKDAQTYGWLNPGDVTWSKGTESRQPVGEVSLYSSVLVTPRPNAASDGNKVIGVIQQFMTPPEVFVHDLRTNQTAILTDLNGIFRHIALGHIERIEWHDRFGGLCKGIFIKPIGFDPTRRYPLVIMNKGWLDNWFFGDTQFQTAFPPQPLASAGFLVLLAQEPHVEENLKGYPGGVGEAYKFLAMLESAIQTMTERGPADPKRIGIMGFSRTSWLTDFVLTHSNLPFAAASSADSGVYMYGSYWEQNRKTLMDGYEEMLGGPPYGATFENWLTYSAGFKAQKVQAPLLMEVTQSPGDTIRNMEFFVALRRQGKAVEFYYYPHGEHILDTPFQRVASLQRNVDWFRFWMQGYEGNAPPYDPEQYVRWRKLREQQEWNDRLHARGKDPVAEFLRQTTPGAVVRDADRAPAASKFIH